MKHTQNMKISRYFTMGRSFGCLKKAAFLVLLNMLFTTVSAQYAEPGIGGGFYTAGSVHVGEHSVLEFNYVNTGPTAIPAGSIEITIDGADSFYKTDGTTAPSDGGAFTWVYSASSDIWRGINTKSIEGRTGATVFLTFTGISTSTVPQPATVNINRVGSFGAFTNDGANDGTVINLTIAEVADIDGDGDPNTSDPEPENPCVFGEGQVYADATAAFLSSDCDGDGVVNETEYASGTDPLDGCSFFANDITLAVASLVCTPSLEVTQTAAMSGSAIGDVIVYTITVANTGNAVLTAINSEETFLDVNGNSLTTTGAPVFVSATQNSLEGTLLSGEVATYTATYTITQNAIDAGGVSSSVRFSAVGANDGVAVADVSDDGDDMDGNTVDDATETPIECLTVYNLFSNNSDGVNDTLIISCIDRYPNNSLEIYSKSGERVYKKKGYSNDFSGLSNVRTSISQSDELPAGTYYYVLNLGDGSDQRLGWIYINNRALVKK